LRGERGVHLLTQIMELVSYYNRSMLRDAKAIRGGGNWVSTACENGAGRMQQGAG
jgi:hypothetical protein